MKKMSVSVNGIVLYLLFFTFRNDGVQVIALSACGSEIWCDGPLLRAVQNARIFEDSKTFVDMNLKHEPDVVLSMFSNISNGGTPNKEQIKTFLQKYFDGPNLEFEKWTPTDFNESPAFLAKVKDGELKTFGKAMCDKWKHLGRKIKQEVKDNEDRYSLIYVDNPFIVPGGRFREIYYWDSYWVIKGLLVCEMKETVKGMLENFISLVKRYGMVPNGNRIYYTRRSQPPLLIPMVDLYFEATNDIAFLTDNIDYLAEEYNFWMTNRSISIDDHQDALLNRYAAPTTEPRPESYREDIDTQRMSKDIQDSSKMFQNLASAAESGWDFSSRWFSSTFRNQTSGDNNGLQYTATTDVIPVDLNSILCWNERLMAKFYLKLGQQNTSLFYESQQKNRQNAMMNMFWDQESGIWFDLSLISKSRRKQFYPSNIFPLFVGCYTNDGTSRVESEVLKYLQTTNVLNYESGVPTSLQQTGQQWDFPNAWPPLQHVLVTALTNGDLQESRTVGQRLALNWVRSNYIGWKSTGNMFEKYVVTAKGSRGGGGEYDVQDGFGWTNGVILDFLDRFGQNLTAGVTSNGQRNYLPLSFMFVSASVTTLFSWQLRFGALETFKTS